MAEESAIICIGLPESSSFEAAGILDKMVDIHILSPTYGIHCGLMCVCVVCVHNGVVLCVFGMKDLSPHSSTVVFQRQGMECRSLSFSLSAPQYMHILFVLPPAFISFKNKSGDYYLIKRQKFCFLISQLVNLNMHLKMNTRK